MLKKILVSLSLTTALAVPAMAIDETFETSSGKLHVQTFATGLENPWGIALLPDGGYLVTERAGRLRFVDATGTVSAPLSGLPAVDTRQQGGLLDIVLHPDFANNRYVYFSFAETGENETTSTAVARAKLAPDNTAISDVEVIFSQLPKVASTLHYGSRLVFDNDGYLFITTGERSMDEFRPQSQDLNSHLGKIIRLHDDGSVPDDNPFVGQADAKPEIWSFGHRNSQGAALRPTDGQLWASEHGPKGGDELNKVVKAGNYGWPLVTYGTEYSGAPIDPPATLPADLLEPATYWTPSPALAGMIFYTGDAFPQWQGDIIMGALAGKSLMHVKMDGDTPGETEFMLKDLNRRIRDVEQLPDGTLLLITDDGTDEILHVSPAK